MLIFAFGVLAVFATFLLVLALVFFSEVATACLLPLRESETSAVLGTSRIAVLIPAHNEGAGIKPTIEDVNRQLRSGDRLLVVADNCTDDTAKVARESGAEVSVRNDETKIGKGYALAWGVEHLAVDPPDILIVIDADCRVADGTIPKLAERCSALKHPVQALYLMTAVPGSAVNQQVAQFAWRVKNLVRPLGLYSLGLPCQLMGTGMAFPWKLIKSANLSSGFIVEDLKLGLELAAQGHPPCFCPSAIVTSTFPTSEVGSRAQRQRWEQGHLSLILAAAPKLIYKATKQKDIRLLALAFDLLVPPLSLLVSILITATLGTAILAIAGASPIPLFLFGVSLLLVAVAVLLAWIKYGQNDLTMSDFLLIIPYLIRKLGLYIALLAGRKASRWIRADRN